MISLDVRLGWVVKVRPDHLVAHLEAFVKLKPTLDALRLCNVFGQGPAAHITKLPVELIERIGMFLVEPERATARDLRTKQFACFTDDCEPIHHYDSKERAAIASYMCTEDIYGEDLCRDSGEACLCEGTDQEILSRQLSADQLDFVNRFLLGNFEIRYEGLGKHHGIRISGWQDSHDENKDEWKNGVGVPGLSNRSGISHFHRDLCKAVFGIEMMINHIQVANEDHPSAWDSTLLKASTEAYLLLPCGQNSNLRVMKTYYSAMRDDDLPEDEYGPEVENSQLLHLTMPQTPAAKSLRRFDRALRILGLEPEDIDEGLSLTDDQHDDETEEAGTKTPDKKGCIPVLKLLTRVGDYGRLID